MNCIIIINTKLLKNHVDSIDFFANRVEQCNVSIGRNNQGNTREPGTSSHIKNLLLNLILGWNHLTKEQGIQNMKDQGLIDIGNARQINLLIELNNIKKMLYTNSSLLIRN